MAAPAPHSYHLERADAVAALRASEERFQLAVRATDDGIWDRDLVTGVSYVSPRWCELQGYEPHEIADALTHFERHIHPEDRPRAQSALRQHLATHEPYRVEYRLRAKSGEYRWFRTRGQATFAADGKALRITGAMRDITAEREARNALDHLVHFDPLTGLPNRLLFHDRLTQMLARAQRTGGAAALLVVDIDHFTLINETLGHVVADEMLREAALRLSRVAGPDHTVARLGADEFAIAVPDLSATEEVVPLAQKLMASFEQPFMLNGKEIFMDISVGIASFPADSGNADALLRNANIAMHRAKELGRSRFQFYAAEMNAWSMERMNLRRHLRRALERQEFSLEYQPKVELLTGAITGFEALLRWNSPELGETPPASFIPILEETGQIVGVGAWILDSACRQIRAWMDQGITPVPIAVNLSAAQVLRSDVDVRIASILDEHGVEPRFLELEVTESVLMQHQERVTIVLRNLRQMGIRIAIDDFGTGYSSLSYLRSFPLDTLKIDRSFVQDVIKNGETALITQAVIAMALKLHLRIVAEGVESRAQLAFLVACGCDEIQGFYFSPAIIATECTQMLIDRRKLDIPNSRNITDGRTLLLIDDDPRILSALKRVLRGDGYNILTAPGAAEALELLACNNVAVVVTDQRMPEMTGVEFLMRIKDIYPDVVRIMLSGYTDFRSITDAINQGGVYKYLTKPWDDQVLRTTLSEAFRRNAADVEYRRRQSGSPQHLDARGLTAPAPADYAPGDADG